MKTMIEVMTFLSFFVVFDIAFLAALALCCADPEFRKAFIEDWKNG